MKKISALLTLSIILVFLSGCWDYSEIEDVSIANTVALDKDEKTGDYIMNVEIVEISASTTGVDITPIIVESRGPSIIDAFRNMISITSKTPYWGHLTTVVLSQDLAREGIAPVLDWVARSQQARLTLSIFISKEKSAKEILFREQEFTKIRSFEYERVKKSNRYLAKLPDIEAYKVINQVQSKDLYSVLPTVEIINLNGKDTAHYIGSAYFDKGKLGGFFNPIDTMKYLFVIDKIEGGVLIIPTDEEDNKKVSLEIYRNNTTTDISFRNDTVHISVNIRCIANIIEADSKLDFSSEDRVLLKKKADEYLEKEISSFIEKVQQNPGIYIFNFGNKIKKRYPGIWKDIEKDWESIFKDLEIEVNSDIRIKNSYNISKPIGAK